MRLLIALFVLLLTAPQEYRQSIEKWRNERETNLKADDGWLTLTGLFWLDEGANAVGSAKGSKVELPGGFAKLAGVMERKGSSVVWKPASGSPRSLATDKTGKPDVIEIGRLKLHVVERGTKLGIRMKDPESPARRNFTGLHWFPVREDWRIQARFVPYSATRKMRLDAQAGGQQEFTSPGYVEWEHGGRSLKLTPVTEGNQLFFIFRDKTAGKTTYPAARFLYADLPKNGKVEVDFNKAYNPPCVFTPYATCPLPPPENRLSVPVEAGEMMYAGH